VLPSGFVYWDVDTETDTAIFLGETVLAPNDYSQLIYGVPFVYAASDKEYFNGKPWHMEVMVGDDVYRLNACPAQGLRCQQDIYPGSGMTDLSWNDAKLSGQLDPPNQSAHWTFDIVFSLREIWTLRRFGPTGAFKHSVPLPISVHQLPQEKLLRSGCACNEAVPAVDYSCLASGPYMCGTSFYMEPNHEWCRCSGGTLAEMPVPEEQVERLYAYIYHMPYEGDGGMFTSFLIEGAFAWQQFNNSAEEQCQDNGTGEMASWPPMDSQEQSIWLANLYSGGTFIFNEQCAQYSSIFKNPFSVTSGILYSCYDKPNSLCPGVRTCVTVDSVDWSFQGLVKYRSSRVVEEPDLYPKVTEFIELSGGVDPSVPCDFETKYALPLWDW